ncbi:BH0509 family protein [Lysinibacillus pakistanensis]|uniref:BH0509 family protein n=1 Tax=Lysinibacillus pakistanensis TaxID=759811 RepID=A0AAX3X0W0_9BACI|nr:BH0509 family protein [Lysinibacillus pakistanensis]MDM5233357.1 BH0509 family protein [Lysinibacillus pakistanensis]WHY48831.1 BH0509 family protein [Lysinibacillus pakistanensis]WHY53843.1 BH0509 family protein [Lysinibacillus pakistanensis]
MSKQEREEIIAIIMLRKNYAEEMLRNMSDKQLLKTYGEL